MNRPSPSRVRVSGPLGAYAAGFREELSTLGYSARSAAGHLQQMAHLSRWLVEIGLAPRELTMRQVERFVRCRRDGSRVHRSLTLRGMRPLLIICSGSGLLRWLTRRPRRVVVTW